MTLQMSESRSVPVVHEIVINLRMLHATLFRHCIHRLHARQGDVGIVAQLAEMLQASTRGLRSCRPVETAAQKKQWWKVV